MQHQSLVNNLVWLRHMIMKPFCMYHEGTRDRRDQIFWFDTDTDTFSGSRSIPRLILILKIGLNRDRYWYWYQENVPGLILIPRLYLIRILSRPYKKCTSLWIDTGTDTETQKKPQSRLILIPKGLVSAFSIRYWYSRLSLACATYLKMETKLSPSICHFYNCLRNISEWQNFAWICHDSFF